MGTPCVVAFCACPAPCALRMSSNTRALRAPAWLRTVAAVLCHVLRGNVCMQVQGNAPSACSAAVHSPHRCRVWYDRNFAVKLLAPSDGLAVPTHTGCLEERKASSGASGKVPRWSSARRLATRGHAWIEDGRQSGGNVAQSMGTQHAAHRTYEHRTCEAPHDSNTTAAGAGGLAEHVCSAYCPRHTDSFPRVGVADGQDPTLIGGGKKVLEVCHATNGQAISVCDVALAV